MPRIDKSRIASGKRAVRSCAYTCSRNTLAAINTIFLAIGLTLILLAAYGKKEALLVYLPALGGIIACGVFLLLVAVLGLIGALKHNQVILFFYMIIMGLLFIILLACSVAALAVTSSQQKKLIEAAWNVDVDQRIVVQEKFKCCGLDQRVTKNNSCPSSCLGEENKCPTCLEQLGESLDKVWSVVGGVGLFFSFTLLLAVYLTVKFRNQKDPRHNADAFL